MATGLLLIAIQGVGSSLSADPSPTSLLARSPADGSAHSTVTLRNGGWLPIEFGIQTAFSKAQPPGVGPFRLTVAQPQAGQVLYNGPPPAQRRLGVLDPGHSRTVTLELVRSDRRWAPGDPSLRVVWSAQPTRQSSWWDDVLVVGLALADLAILLFAAVYMRAPRRRVGG